MDQDNKTIIIILVLAILFVFILLEGLETIDLSSMFVYIDRESEVLDVYMKRVLAESQFKMMSVDDKLIAAGFLQVADHNIQQGTTGDGE